MTDFMIPRLAVHAYLDGGPDHAQLVVGQYRDDVDHFTPGHVDISVRPRPYGQPGRQVTVNYPALGAQTPAETALQAAIIGEAAAIGATLERLVNVEGMTVDLAVRTTIPSPRFPFQWTIQR